VETLTRARAHTLTNGHSQPHTPHRTRRLASSHSRKHQHSIFYTHAYANACKETHHQHPAHEIFGVVRNTIPVWRRKRVVSPPNLPEKGNGILAVERREPTKHNVKNNSDAPHINFRPIAKWARKTRVQNFWRYVSGCPAHRPHSRTWPPQPANPSTVRSVFKCVGARNLSR